MMLQWLTVCVLLFAFCISDNIEDEFFLDDFGAWILCRKIVEGVNGHFGVGYDFTVKYELTNIGTQNAHNIKIEDTWNWQYVQRFGDQIHSENIVFEHNELKPKSTVTFSYKLTPISMGRIMPNRANISYSVGDDDDNDYSKINGQSSNWINTRDHVLMIENEINNKYDKNINNDQLIILSSSMYSRAISSTIIYWILFIIFSIISIIYPLCEYESNKGDFSFMSFGVGQYIKTLTRFINLFIVSKIRQQIAKINKGKINKSN